jgi:hypothetical protein
LNSYPFPFCHLLSGRPAQHLRLHGNGQDPRGDQGNGPDQIDVEPPV